MKALKVLIFLVATVLVSHSFAESSNETTYMPKSDENVADDIKGSITPPTAEQQAGLEKEVKKAGKKGEAKKKKKNKKESKKTTH